MNTPLGMAYITINNLDDVPSEIFLIVGKAGSDVFAMAEALGRVCSLFLRYGDHGNKVQLLIKHLKGIGGTGAIGFGQNRVESIADAVAKALEMHVQKTACIEGQQQSAASIAGNGQGLVNGQALSNGNGQSSAQTDTDAEAGLTNGLEQLLGAHELSNLKTAEGHNGNVSPSIAGSIDLCPSCGSASLISIEGCKQCSSCGYSKCG